MNKYLEKVAGYLTSQGERGKKVNTFLAKIETKLAYHREARSGRFTDGEQKAEAKE